MDNCYLDTPVQIRAGKKENKILQKKEQSDASIISIIKRHQSQHMALQTPTFLCSSQERHQQSKTSKPCGTYGQQWTQDPLFHD